MKLSVVLLGRQIDAAVGRGAFVFESATAANVSNLTIDDAQLILRTATDLHCPCHCTDGQDNEWRPDELNVEFAPFRISVTKPAFGESVVPVFSIAGFAGLLGRETKEPQWRIAGLARPIRTLSTVFLPWDKVEAVTVPFPAKNPRFLVREYSADRRVPEDVRSWILRENEVDDLGDPFFTAWARVSTLRLLTVLPNEIDVETGELKFRGPPRLALKMPSNTDVDEFWRAGHGQMLQAAVRWIFENERETESRHALLSAELARSGGGDGNALHVLAKELETSLQGARIAYEMSLSAMSFDTLKALGDLRKAVTEETAKVTEATRQTITAVTGALAVGIGLVAAKASTTVGQGLIWPMMLLVLGYVGMVVIAGAQFVGLQRRLRSSWQPKLYRFLPDADYKTLVKSPTFRAELAFWSVAIIGIGAVLYVAYLVYTAGGVVPPAAGSSTH